MKPFLWGARLSATMCTLLCIVASTLSVTAQEYPARPITFIVSFAPGGLSDVPARLLSAKLQQLLGRPVIVENKPGASGINGASYVQRANPDGYTLLVSAISEVQNLYYISVPYKFTSDFTQIGKIADGPTLALIVNANSPYKTVADLVKGAKENPEKVTFATSGPATSPAIAVSQLNSMAGTKILDVPYRGTALAVTAVLSQEVQGAFVYYPSAQALVEDGKVRALAVTSAERMERWKDVPTMVEQGYPGFLYDAFVALAGPPNMPPSIVDKLNKALNEVLQTPAFREQLDSLGMVPPKSDNSPKGLSEFLIRETDHQAELAKLSGRTLVK